MLQSIRMWRRSEHKTFSSLIAGEVGSFQQWLSSEIPMDSHYWMDPTSPTMSEDFPRDASDKEPASQCRRLERHGFNPWVTKIPWRTKWQSAPVCLPGKSMDRGAWQATVHGVAKSQTRQSMHTLKIQWGCVECGEIWFCSPLPSFLLLSFSPHIFLIILLVMHAW